MKAVDYLNKPEMQSLKTEAKDLGCSVSMLIRTHLRKRKSLVPVKHLF